MPYTANRNSIPPTNEDTVGPYFPIYFDDPGLEDLTRIYSGLAVAPVGRPIILRGHLLDRHGDLAHGVVMEFWQANANGVYRTPAHADHPDLDPWFDGFGRIRTKTGAFELRTIMPGATPGRAPNITVTLFSDGISRIVTQLFFEGQDSNDTDPLLSSLQVDDVAKLIARREGCSADGAEIYTLDIIMAGADETPFFDDLQS